MCFNKRLLLLLLLTLSHVISHVSAQAQTTITFTNVLDEPVRLYWMNPDDPGNPVPIGELQPHEGSTIDTYIGHSFAFDDPSYSKNNDIQRRFVTVRSTDSDQNTVIVGPTHYQVDCSTSTGTFRAHIWPRWSPFGAARFLELVRIGYFTGCALNRVVPNFLTQFGISSNYQLRTRYRSLNIRDDPPITSSSANILPFEPGYMAYAGSGPDSRTTEMFIVMPNTPQHQLGAFGQNPWETPFGYVEMDDVETVVAKWHAYGDIPPWGKGPDPQRIYRSNGYDEYLANDFPDMSYIEFCQIISYDYDDDGMGNNAVGTSMIQDYFDQDEEL